MRGVVLWLIIGWLGGLAAGSWSVSLWIVAISILLLGYTVWRVYSVRPLVAGLGILYVLGWVYTTPLLTPPLAPCEFSSPLYLVVTQRPEHGARSSRYTTQSSEGCQLVVTTARFPLYAVGDTLEVRGATPQSLDELRQELPGYADYLARRGVRATLYFPAMTVVTSAPHPPGIYEVLDRQITRLFREPDASVVRALILADDAGLPAELTDNFRATGLSHLLAISGMNISLLTGMALVVLQLLPLSPRSRTILLCALLWGYMALINWPVSAMRATFFWTITLLALRLRVLASLPTVFFLTVAGSVSYTPALLNDIGFQLSVTAVAGIFMTLFMTRKVLAHQGVWIKVVFGASVLTLGATLTTWPIIMYHFGTVAWLSVPANLLVAPVVGIQMAAAIATLLVGSISASLALLPAYLAHLTVAWMQVVSSFIAGIPGAYWEQLSLPAEAMAIYYLVMVIICHYWLRHQRRSWREVWE